MIILNGKYNEAKVFTDNIEESAREQIVELLNQEFVKGENIRIMSDVHAGAGCTIGFTSTITNKVVPNLIGVDIGCLDKDTEVLTPDGWVKISDYSNTSILVYDKFTDKSFFSKPYAYIKKECDEFFHFKNSKGLDQMVSEEHRMLVFSGYKKNGYRKSDMFPKELARVHKDSGYYGFKASFNFENESSVELTDNQIRLDVMIQADGCVRSPNRYELHFSKDRKIKRAEELLSIEGIEYNKYIARDGTTYITFYSDLGFNKDLTKYYKADKRQLKIVCDESLLWDGHVGYRSYYSSTNKLNADLIQFAFSSNDIRAGISQQDNTYYVTPTKNNIVGYSQNPEKVASEDGYKYCFTTETGYFVARRNGKIFITGNCGLLMAKLSKRIENLDELDSIIRYSIPSGFNVRKMPVSGIRYILEEFIADLHCFNSASINMNRVLCSVGTLGGGEVKMIATLSVNS